MRVIKPYAIFLPIFALALLAGCNSDLQQCRLQNDTQRKRISDLNSQLQTAKLNLQQAQRQLEAAQGRGDIEVDALKKHVAALEEDLQKKKALIASMQKQLLYGGVELPAELSTMLEDFANSEPMVTYDAGRGIVKFKSDLLFEKGSDKVLPDAAKAVDALCKILNNEQGKKFDIIIAGHTDDIPIAKASTRQKHPTNWHLSADRAISVLELMVKDKIPPERMSIRGFGEYRPAVPNKPNKRGNPENRRVEIYIVPKGM